jgi:hypothetical protein
MQARVDILNRLQRLDLANRVAREIAEKHGENILSVAIGGSLSKEEDLQFSDLDLVVITREKVRTEIRVIEGVVTEYIFATLDDLTKIISDPKEESWSFWASIISRARTILGKDEIIEQLRRDLNNVPREKYEEAAKLKLPLILEYSNHVKNAVLRNDLYSAIFNSLWMTNVVGEFTALINFKFFSTNVFRSLIQAREFSLIPNDFFKLMEGIYVEKKLDSLANMTERLCQNCFDLATKTGLGSKH